MTKVLTEILEKRATLAVECDRIFAYDPVVVSWYPAPAQANLHEM